MSTRLLPISSTWQPPTVSPRIAGLGLLVSLTIAGMAAGVARLLSGMGATTWLNNVYPWGIWIGFDFALIALSGAGFTMAGVVHVLHLHRFEAAFRPALFAGLLGYVAVLLLLVLDLGRPDRFYHFILYWNIHSPLFEISWCVLLYSTVLMIEVSPDILSLLKWRWVGWVKRMVLKVMPVVCILGVTLSSLHQSTLGTLYVNMPHRLHPLWYSPYLPFLFFVSAVMAGLAVAVVAYRVACVVHRQEFDVSVAQGLAVGIMGAGLIYGASRLAVVAAEGKLPLALAPTFLAVLFWVEIVVTVVLPLLLFAWARIQPQSWLYWTAPALVILGVGMNRFDSTLAAQIPVWQGVYIPHPLEWISTVGILAGALFVWLLAVRFLARGEPAHHHS